MSELAVDLLSSKLLGRGVAEALGRNAVPPIGEVLGDAEVGQIRVPVVVEEHVGRLHVAVDRVGAVRRGERAGELIHDPRRVLRVRLPAYEDVLEAAAAHPSHHEVRATAVAPVVVERNDVRVLQPGNGLRLLLESPDEDRVVGQLRVDLLDPDLASELGVERPPHDTERALADAFQQSVASQRTPGELQRRVLLEDPSLELLELRRRVDPQLVREQVLRVPIGVERFCLPAGSVAREHQMPPQTLAHRMLDDDALELGQHLGVVADREPRSEEILDRRYAELVPAGRSRRSATPPRPDH